MKDQKVAAVEFLLRNEPNNLDRESAKLLAKCNLDVRHAGGGAAGPQVDVMIHGDHETIEKIKSGDFAGRIENAIRESGPSLRHLQWVETKTPETGPRSGAGVGVDGDHDEPMKRSNEGMAQPPKWEHHQQGDFQPPDQPGDKRLPRPDSEQRRSDKHRQ